MAHDTESARDHILLLVGLVAMATLSLVFLGGAPAQASEQVTLEVEGMVCPNCEATVEQVLAQLDGVHEVSADLSSNQALVAYDPAAIEPYAMTEHLTARTFYEADIARPAPVGSVRGTPAATGSPTFVPLAVAGLGAAALTVLILARRPTRRDTA